MRGCQWGGVLAALLSHESRLTVRASGVKITLPALTEKDKADLTFGSQQVCLLVQANLDASSGMHPCVGMRACAMRALLRCRHLRVSGNLCRAACQRYRGICGGSLCRRKWLDPIQAQMHTCRVWVALALACGWCRMEGVYYVAGCLDMMLGHVGDLMLVTC